MVKDSLAFKNLRTLNVQESSSELLITDGNERQRREEHQILLTCHQHRVVLLHSNPYLGKVFMFELDPNNVYRYTQ